MKKGAFLLLMSLLAMVAFSPNLFALSISTSGSGDSFGDTYSYEFLINDNNDQFDGIFDATLTNTSESQYEPLIWRLGFNLADPDPTLGEDFFIDNASPNWVFRQISRGGIQFDYTGDTIGDPGNRLLPGQALTFRMRFTNNDYITRGFEIFTGGEESSGTGFGGGEDIGRIAVGFQQLGLNGEGSDLLASSGYTAAPVPEPSTILLMGFGLLGLVAVGRQKFNRKE
jgi:hypothetical protein